VQIGGGELLVAFRRAPDRRTTNPRHMIDHEKHLDSNSYLVTVRSQDGGATWTSEPELMYAHPLGGSQDPCMVRLGDGTIICTSYGWLQLDPEVADRFPRAYVNTNYAFLGGFLLRSADSGKTWQGPIIPPPLPDDPMQDSFGRPLPTFNRGALCEGRDGRLYWVVSEIHSGATATHLMVSDDRGQTWKHSSVVARDSKITFNETSLCETAGGDLVAFMRTGDALDDHIAVARSRDLGRSFEPWQDTGVQGHPMHAIRMVDGSVLLVFGYRHLPGVGIRARLLDPECTDIASAEELVLRDDGGTGDLGYPWAVAVPDNRALVVYYFNDDDDGPRYIAGTMIEIT
jgi:hypothetical protein